MERPQKILINDGRSQWRVASIAMTICSNVIMVVTFTAMFSFTSCCMTQRLLVVSGIIGTFTTILFANESNRIASFTISDAETVLSVSSTETGLPFISKQISLITRSYSFGLMPSLSMITWFVVTPSITPAAFHF